ncbi:unnamed protein product [Rotaria socialis]
MILSIKFVEKKKTSRSSEWWKFVRVEIEFRSPVPFFTPTPISENIFLTIPIPTSENTRSLPTSALPMSMTQPVSIVAPITIVGQYPMQCTCFQCRRQIVTRTEKKNGLLVWISIGALFIFGFWVCCCIPLCIDACKDTEHYCPSCNPMLGISKKL